MRLSGRNILLLAEAGVKSRERHLASTPEMIRRATGKGLWKQNTIRSIICPGVRDLVGEMDFADKDIRDLLPFVPANSTALVEGQGETCEDPTSPGVHFVPISEVEAETAPRLAETDPGLGDSLMPDVSALFVRSPIDVAPSDPVLIADPAPGAMPSVDGIKVSEISLEIDAGRADGDDIPDTVRGEPAAHAKDNPKEPQISDGEVEGGRDAHSVTLSQIADIDQDASILVHGYGGKVVARLHIDQTIRMDQDINLAFSLDGTGHFAVRIDQQLSVEQEIDIDLEIFEDDGVLYIDLDMSDSIEIEQDTNVGISITDGPPGGVVEVSQDMTLDQDVDVDIDIEDDLADRYVVTVAIDVTQEIDTDQDANVDADYENGELDLDIEATQMAAVDQEMIAQIDFAAI